MLSSVILSLFVITLVFVCCIYTAHADADAHATTTTPATTTTTTGSKDNLFFVETFEEDIIESGKWIKSEMEKYVNQRVFVKPSLQAAEGFEADNGLRLAADMTHYGIGTLFPKPLISDGKDIIIQYGMLFIIIIRNFFFYSQYISYCLNILR